MKYFIISHHWHADVQRAPFAEHQKVIPMLPKLLCEQLCSLNRGSHASKSDWVSVRQIFTPTPASMLPCCSSHEYSTIRSTQDMPWGKLSLEKSKIIWNFLDKIFVQVNSNDVSVQMATLRLKQRHSWLKTASTTRSLINT